MKMLGEGNVAQYKAGCVLLSNIECARKKPVTIDPTRVVYIVEDVVPLLHLLGERRRVRPNHGTFVIGKRLSLLPRWIVKGGE